MDQYSQPLEIEDIINLSSIIKYIAITQMGYSIEPRDRIYV